MCWILIYGTLEAAYILNGSQHSGTPSAVYSSDCMVLWRITWCDSLMTVPCSPKYVGLLSVIL
jgi:hypothetical protein